MRETYVYGTQSPPVSARPTSLSPAPPRIRNIAPSGPAGNLLSRVVDAKGNSAVFAGPVGGNMEMCRSCVTRPSLATIVRAARRKAMARGARWVLAGYSLIGDMDGGRLDLIDQS
jgi:hypothetical protein